MKRRLLALFGSGSLALTLAVGALSSSSDAVQPGWMSSAAITPAFFQQQGTPSWTPGGGGGTSRSHLPSSVMPHNALQCSVDTSDTGSPPSCSVRAVAANRCSAHCDSGQQCSAFSVNFAVSAEAICSTFGVAKTLCSALQPNLGGVVAPTRCSAFNANPNHRISCSVMDVGRKQFCSAENPANSPNNECSTFTSNNARATCSVLNGGALRRNFCSTAFPGQKRCSIFQFGGECSVVPGNKSLCTNLAGAPTGSCSTHAGAVSGCSVIGGTPGFLCRQ